MIANKTTWLLAGFLCLALWPVHVSAQDVQVDEIHDAAGKGDAERVTDLLLARPELVNAKTKKGRTPLHFAADSGHREIAELLLDNDADPNVKAATGSTPLHLAIPTLRIEDVVPKLRDAGLTDRNVEDYYRALGQGGDASTIASSFPEDIDIGVIREAIFQSSLPPVETADRVAVVRLLIEEGADVNATNSIGQTPLSLAVMNPDRIMTAILVANRANVNAFDKAGESVLHNAAMWGGKETVSLLLASGANVDIQNRYWNTPLAFALDRRNLDIAELLIDGGADVNIKNKFGFTPLHVASQSGQKDAVAFLLAHGSEVDPKDNEGWTPLNRAAANGHYTIAEMLLDNGADLHAKDNEGFTPLITAAENGYEDIVGLLLDDGADVHARTDYGGTALHVAGREGDVAVVDLLLTHNSDVNAKDFEESTPIHYAAVAGNPAAVKLLLAKGAETEARNKYGNTPLHRVAFGSGNVEVAQLLLASGADLEARNDYGDVGQHSTPLLAAVGRGHQALVVLLLSRNADVTATDQHGATPLHWAASNNHRDVMNLLLAHDSDIGAKDQYGKTPLHIAAAKGNYQLIEILLTAGAAVDARGVVDQTPLHDAAFEGRSEVVKVLLTNRAEVEARTNDGETPLMLAARNGHRDVAELLLTHGAELDARDTNDFMPLHKATDHGQPAVAELLLAHGADLNAKVNDGRVPLHLAFQAHLVQQGDLAKESGYRAVAKLLLAHNADLTAQDDNGRTPLLTAALGGNPFAVELLLVNGASIDARDNWGQTALHLAAHAEYSTPAKYVEVIRILIARGGATVHARASIGQTPLHQAAEKGHLAVAEMLLAHGAKINAEDNGGVTPLHWAAQGGHQATVELLLAHGADVTAQEAQRGATPLHWAVWNRHGPVAKVLLTHEADANAWDDDSSTPLHWGVDSGDTVVTKLLLAHGADVNAKASNGSTPLHFAAKKNHVAVAEALLAHRARVDARDNGKATPLHSAALGGHEGIVELLLAHAADVNAKNVKIQTPLHLAAFGGHKSVVRALLSHGAEVNPKIEGFLNAPLHLAAFSGHRDVAEMLLEYGADVNAKRSTGDTPLIVAADEGHGEVVELLLAKQAHVNAKNLMGITPLHAAAWKNHKAVAEVLVARGADTDARTNMGSTPLELATGNSYTDLAEFLREHTSVLAEESGATPVGGMVVGNFGDTERLSFEGIATFSEETLRNGLMEDSDFLLASHHAAPLAEYLAAIRKKITAGYQHAGFPEAQTTATFDSSTGRIGVKVVEGPRYMSGGVTVVGAKSIPVDALIRRLTEWYPPKGTTTVTALNFALDSGVPELPGDVIVLPGGGRLDSTGKEVDPIPPIWQKDEPASFDESSVQGLAGGVRRVLADFGYFFPEVDVNVVPDKENGTAEFLVEILDEGPKGIIEKIQVSGNTKDTNDEVLAYLSLKPGMTFNRDVITKTNLLLWRAARFLDYEVTPERVDSEVPKVNLIVKLTEYEPAPSLGKEFSGKEKALLKLRDWLSDATSRGEDIILYVNNWLPEIDALEFILSNRGALVLIKDSGATGTGTLRSAAVLSPEMFALFSPGQQRKLVGSGPVGWQWMGHASVLPDADAASGGDLTFGVSFKTAEPGDDTTLFRLNIRLAPVVFLSFAHDPDYAYSLNEGVFTVASNNLRLKADVQTGILKEFLWSKFTNPEEKIEFGIRIEKGAFDRTIQEIGEATAGHQNYMDTTNPLNSWIGYLVEDALQSDFLASFLFADTPREKRVRAASVLRKVFDRKIMNSLNTLVAQFFSDEGELFYIPLDQPESMEAATRSMYAGAYAAVFKYSNDFFPKGSWPWTAARESVFVLGGKGKYTRAELERIYESKQTGPLGYLTIAKLLTYIKHPTTRAFAHRGLERLSADDFRKDIRLFLEGDSLLVQSVEEIVLALRDMDDDEIEAIGAILPPEAGKFLRQTAQLLRAANGKPNTEVLEPALDEYWDRALKEQIEAELKELAGS